MAEGSAAHFMGEETCRSAGCHGGGEGKNQCVIWSKKDVHAAARDSLTKALAQRIAEALTLPEAAKSARCTVCHSPLQGLPESRLAGGVPVTAGVSCESCHGAAEPWLRYHARTDLTHEQRLAGGMRPLHAAYERANACVACHLNLDPALLTAGHPELTFELAEQLRREPPHWTAEPDPWAGPRCWQTGQAAALRELSWKGALLANEEIRVRARGVAWLLRQTRLGQTELPEGDDLKAMQPAADRLAHAASQAAWTQESTRAQLHALAGTSITFRDAAVAPAEQQRRAEALALGTEECWQALKAAGAASPPLEAALSAVVSEARGRKVFQPEQFAAALQQVAAALDQLPPVKS